ncbi:MAG: lysophospholipid acyltransferase family protein [Pseudomonadota bacterium]
MSKPEPKSSPLDWLIDRILRGLLRLALALPYERRVAFIGWMVADVLAPLTGYKSRAIANLKMVYPDLSATELKARARAVCNNVGRTIIENYSTEEFAKRARAIPLQGPGLDALKEARAQGRPVLFVTAHFANYEAPRHALDAAGISVAGVFRAMSNAYFHEHYMETLLSVSGPMFEQGSGGARKMVVHLKRGGCVAIGFDLYFPSGALIPFMGHPAKTALSSAEVGVKLEALVIPYFAMRKDNGLDFDVIIDAPIPHAAPEEMLLEMNKRLEAMIAQKPDQWFWTHRRWKGIVR